MKSIYYLSSVFFLLLIVSCDQDNASPDLVNEIKTSGILMIENGTVKTKTSGRELSDKDFEIEFKFESNTPMPNIETQEEAEHYFNENKENISGRFVFTINGDVVSTNEVVNGESISNSKAYVSGKTKGCNFDDISSCTQDRIDRGNWLEKAFCIVRGFECVAENFAYCTVDQCLP